MPPEHAASPLPLFAIIVLIFYFIVFKPEQDRKKKHKEKLTSLKKNDQVVTVGGAHGTVVIVKDKTVVLRVDDNVRIEFDKESVASVTPTQTS